MTGHEQDTDITDSNPNASGPERAAGGMGVSSERVGHAGPGQESTDGTRDVRSEERPPDADTPPEQATGNPEANPEGIAPKAGYSSQDPRSAD